MSEDVFTWDDERVATLQQMVADRKTAAEIAECLGGVSRNAVAGKAHRLGLTFNASPYTPGAPAPRPKPSRPRAPAMAKPRARPERPVLSLAPPEPEIEPTAKLWPKPAGPDAVTLAGLDMGRQCRMPLWAFEDKGGFYCGKPVIERPGPSGKPEPHPPWCPACAKLVYEPARSRPRERPEREAPRREVFA